jgi:hypothetical protein
MYDALQFGQLNRLTWDFGMRKTNVEPQDPVWSGVAPKRVD